MAAGDLALKVLISASAGGALTTINQLTSALGSGGLAGVMLAAGAAATVGLGIAAVKAAGDFQSALAKVQAYAGYTKQQTEAMGNSILQMAPQLGLAPKALADSLYMVASAGFKGADSLQILRYAGMTAAASNADASKVTYDLVASLSAMRLGAGSAGNIMDELNGTVKNGLLTWDSYGSVVGSLAGAVSTAGGGAKLMQSNFAGLNAALDVYTNAGKSAHQASQYLSADMTFLNGKTDTIAKNAAKLGIQFNATKFSTMDFAHQVQYLSQVTDGNRGELVKLLSGNSTVANSIQFLNNNYKSFSSTLANITSHMQKGKTTQDMFAVAQQTLNFKVQQAQAAFQSLLITLGTALLPVITNIVARVTPAITGFSNWLSSGNRLQNALHAVGEAIKGITGFIGGLISGIGRVISFFQQNQVAAAALLIPLGALGGYFVFLGVSAIAAFIAAAPAMIGGFIAGAAAAWTMAAGVIAATWPFLLIGAAIGLVIAIVVLLVQHWGQVVAFLRGVWGAVSTWFMNTLKIVGQFFANVWTNIVTNLRNAWTFIVSIVQAGLTWLLNAFLAPFRAIGALFEWLYQHNTYFQMLVDAIRTIVQAGVTWLQNIWQTVIGWLTTQWNYLRIGAQVAWAAVSAVVMSVVNAITGWLHNIWTTATQWLGNQWNTLKGLAKTAWDNVTSTFSAAWGPIANVLSGLWKNISSWFTNLGTQMLQFGKNLIQQLINGIQSMLGALGNAASNAAATVAKFLGFHSPAEAGPGSTAHLWMPALITMMATGLIAGVPKVAGAANQVAGALAFGNGSYGGLAAPMGNNAFTVQTSGSGYAGPSTLQIALNVDGKKMTQVVGVHMQNEIRRQGVVRNR